ncbi:uncharacterized protein LOC120979846, partial [Bufo bufo]|uniref:uncharacterized protein LOC120979846 n=1 Tax=Bufo bufo TaxID=8384 RepID=UPI001ABDA7DC
MDQIHIPELKGANFDPRDHDSGEFFIEQLQKWAKARLADQSTTLQDMTQEKVETVEKFAQRIKQNYKDMGFSQNEPVHLRLLARSFVDGLRPEINKALVTCRPEWKSLTLDMLEQIAKGLESNTKKTRAAVIAVLVVIDLFSGWPEAYPVRNQTATTTAKKLMQELVCRFGVPEVIESDQGPAFTASLTQEVWKMVGSHLAYHTPYRPQSSGKVERLNGVLKSKMLKMTRETGLNWVQCLPITLFSVRHTPRPPHKLTPYEILFGTGPRMVQYFPQQLQMHYESVAKYVIALSKQLSNIHAQVFSSIPDPNSLEGSHTLKSGEWVVVKKHVRSTLEPRYEGPYQVLLTTPTSVKLEGRPTWIHA